MGEQEVGVSRGSVYSGKWKITENGKRAMVLVKPLWVCYLGLLEDGLLSFPQRLGGGALTAGDGCNSPFGSLEPSQAGTCRVTLRY